MRKPTFCPPSAIVLLALCSFLAGCGGTKVLKEPKAIQTTQPLVSASNEQITATLDWVIVRDGPGAWARNADWDEYLLRVRNRSGQSIEITGLTVVDSLNTEVLPETQRKQLVKGSKKTARRYKQSGIKVRAGRGAGTLLLAGAAVTAVGAGAATVAAFGNLLGGASAVGGAAATASGLLVLGPAIVVGGAVRGVNNSKVNSQIELRQTVLPFEILTEQEHRLSVFFPLAPSPKRLELTYTDTSGEHRLTLNTETALKGLHIDDAEE